MNYNSSDIPPICSGMIKDLLLSVENQRLMASEITPTNVYIHESILSPTVQISITFLDTIHVIKNFIQYKIKGGEMPNMSMTVINPRFNIEGGNHVHSVTRDAELPINNFKVYRMDSRRPLNYHMEQYTLHLCSPSIIKNQIYRMSHFYKMKELSKVVEDAMDSAGIKKNVRFIEKTDLKRDYISNNQHPFQVISEIADMSMKDQHAQFLHYMTTEEVQGKHYFVSLKHLIKRADGKNFKGDFQYSYNEKGANETFYIDDIMTYEFPCDFDTLLDLSGGIIHNKADHKNHKPSMVSINPFDGGVFMVDGKIHGDNKLRGFGGALNAGAWSNKNNFESVKTSGTFIGATTTGDASRPSGVEKYLHKRTENITFLHREKIDLKIVVPFNPTLHAGNLIDVSFFSKREKGTKNKNYGSGIYLIVHLTHDVKVGNYGTSIFECIKIKDTSDFYKELRPDHQILPKLLKEKK